MFSVGFGFTRSYFIVKTPLILEDDTKSKGSRKKEKDKDAQIQSIQMQIQKITGQRSSRKQYPKKEKSKKRKATELSTDVAAVLEVMQNKGLLKKSKLE